MYHILAEHDLFSRSIRSGSILDVTSITVSANKFRNCLIEDMEAMQGLCVGSAKLLNTLFVRFIQTLSYFVPIGLTEKRNYILYLTLFS